MFDKRVEDHTTAVLAQVVFSQKWNKIWKLSFITFSILSNLQVNQCYLHFNVCFFFWWNAMFMCRRLYKLLIRKFLRLWFIWLEISKYFLLNLMILNNTSFYLIIFQSKSQFVSLSKEIVTFNISFRFSFKEYLFYF